VAGKDANVVKIFSMQSLSEIKPEHPQVLYTAYPQMYTCIHTVHTHAYAYISTKVATITYTCTHDASSGNDNIEMFLRSTKRVDGIKQNL